MPSRPRSRRRPVGAVPGSRAPGDAGRPTPACVTSRSWPGETSITPRRAAPRSHAARIAERWAAAGIDVQLTTSRAPGAARRSDRDGYRTTRPAGRYLIFPATWRPAWPAGRARPDGVVEVWNGMPFFSPLWAPHPRVALLHHVHGGMWDLVLPPRLARVGKLIERRLAPPLYAGTPGRDPVGIVPPHDHRQPRAGSRPGDRRAARAWTPASVPRGPKAPTPLVVAVGRLVPYKRFDLLIDVLARVKARHPDLQAVVAGEGSERPRLEALVRRPPGPGLAASARAGERRRPCSTCTGGPGWCCRRRRTKDGA